MGMDLPRPLRPLSWLLGSWGLLAACTGEGGGGLTDGDGDGYIATDCDDSSAATYPGAVEVCDGADNDCDGVVDEDVLGARVLYADADGDGYGDPAAAQQFCEVPAEGSGWVTNFDDCDDTSPDNAPSRAEVCDGIDNDCDGLVDDADESLQQGDWTFDGDGDGYGGDLLPSRCSYIEGYVLEGGDCDDEDATLSPGTAEVCDGIDNDCDDLIDADDLDAVDASTWYPDADGDGYGAQDAGVFSCTALAGAILTGGDCNDADPAVSSGALEVAGDGIDNDCNAVVDELSVRTGWATRGGDAAGDQAGFAVAGLGDTNGDGWRDVVVGAPGADVGGKDAGVAYVLSGAALVADAGDLDGGLWTGALAQLVGEASGDAAGWSVAGGDLNGDGYGDVLVGAPNNDGDGGVFLLYGPLSGRISLRGADATLGGAAAGDQAGWSLDVRDTDGDGRDDLLVGAPGRDSEDGLAYLILGPSARTATLSAIDAATLIDDAEGLLGWSVALAGDMDGDGDGDVLVAAPHTRSGDWRAGKVFGFYGALAGSQDVARDADFSIEGESGFDRLGAAVVGPGDLDGDGYDDVLVGAPEADDGHINGGVVCVLYGSRVRTLARLQVDDCDAVLVGTTEEGRLGERLAAAGNPNRDTRADALLGAPGYPAGTAAVGAVYLLPGAIYYGVEDIADVAAPMLGSTDGGLAGWGMAGVGDIDQDNRDDLLLGEPLGGPDGGGAIYLISP